MRERRTTRFGVVLARTQASKVLRCSEVITRASVGFHIIPLVSRGVDIVKLLLRHYTS
jgi:hypothetical protein